MTPSIAFDAVITVNGTINGGLFTFGQSVSVCPDASVTGNVFRAGRNIGNQSQVEGSFFAGVGGLSILIPYPAALIVAGVFPFALIGLGELNIRLLGLGFSSFGVVLKGLTGLLKFISKSILAFFVGVVLMKQLFPTASNGRSIWGMLMGIFLFAQIGIIPILGWIISLAAIWNGSGGQASHSLCYSTICSIIKRRAVRLDSPLFI